MKMSIKIKLWKGSRVRRLSESERQKIAKLEQEVETLKKGIENYALR